MISTQLWKDLKEKEKIGMLQKEVCPRGHKQVCKEIYDGNNLLCIAVKHDENKVLQLKCVYKR